jgi:hypothetical protein
MPFSREDANVARNDLLVEEAVHPNGSDIRIAIELEVVLFFLGDVAFNGARPRTCAREGRRWTCIVRPALCDGMPPAGFSFPS